ncbi:MAG: YbjN domain-containing protein [Hyphomicrobiales bacterium]|nr:YbjN domain-containing protein [Hyphomicrobiales bacterium]
MPLNNGSEFRDLSPVDVVEQIVSANEWSFDRLSEEEIAVQVPGRWCEYDFYCAWNESEDAVHLMLAFDMRIPDDRRPHIHELLALINDKVWMGHFSIWQDENLLVYRHALPLRGSEGPAVGQIEDLLESGLSECERFYPAFLGVLNQGMDAAQALSAALIDTIGEA